MAVTAILVASAVPAGAQRAWLQVTGPHVSVLSDAGEGQARNIAWQFEQVREAVTRTFPWVRADTALPLLVLAARNETSMRALAPEFWEKGQGSSLASVSQQGRDRIYILLRADARVEDREGINPYQSAYMAYALAALRDTSAAFPRWLGRGLSSVVSNTLVRENEVQVGRVLRQHLERLRTRGRRSLTEVVSFPSDGEPSVDALMELDAHALAFVHFLAFSEQGLRAPLLNAYVRAILSGADPAASQASTIGDVARFDTDFAIYIDRLVVWLCPVRDLCPGDARRADGAQGPAGRVGGAARVRSRRDGAADRIQGPDRRGRESGARGRRRRSKSPGRGG